MSTVCSAQWSTKVIVAGCEVICDEVIPTEIIIIIIAFFLIKVEGMFCVGLLCVQQNGPLK